MKNNLYLMRLNSLNILHCIHRINFNLYRNPLSMKIDMFQCNFSNIYNNHHMIYNHCYSDQYRFCMINHNSSINFNLYNSRLYNFKNNLKILEKNIMIMIHYKINRHFHFYTSNNFRYITNIMQNRLRSNHFCIIYIYLPFLFLFLCNQCSPIDTVNRSSFTNNNQNYKDITIHLKHMIPYIDYNYCRYHNIFNSFIHIKDTKDLHLDNSQSNKNYNYLSLSIKNNWNYTFNIIVCQPIKNILMNN